MSFFKKLGQAIGSAINAAAEENDPARRDRLETLRDQLETIQSNNTPESDPSIPQTSICQLAESPLSAFNTFLDKILNRGNRGKPTDRELKAITLFINDIAPAERGHVLAFAVNGILVIRQHVDWIRNNRELLLKNDRLFVDYYSENIKKGDRNVLYTLSKSPSQHLQDHVRHIVKVESSIRYLIENLQKRAIDLTDEQGEVLFECDLIYGRTGVDSRIYRPIKKALNKCEMPRTIAAANLFFERVKSLIDQKEFAYWDRDDFFKFQVEFNSLAQKNRRRSRQSPSGKKNAKPETDRIDKAIVSIRSLLPVPDSSGPSSRYTAQRIQATEVKLQFEKANEQARRLARSFPSIESWSADQVADLKNLVETARNHPDPTINSELVHILGNYQLFVEASPPFGQVWTALLRHCDVTGSQSAPTRTWLKEARELATRADPRRLEGGILEHVVPLSLRRRHYGSPDYVGDNRLRALIWMAVDLPWRKLTPAFTAYAMAECFSNLRDERTGNGVLWYLENLPDGAGLPYLARLHTQVEYPKVKKRIDAALDKAAKKAGISRDELDELAVPDHGLDKQGRGEVQLDEGSAVISVVGTTTVGVALRLADTGNQTEPTEAALEEGLKAITDEIEADLEAQVPRLQHLYLKNRRIRQEDWIDRYVEHPLVGEMSRRLIWNAHKGEDRISGLWRDGVFQDIDGNPVDLDGVELELWHPMHDRDEALAWRARLQELRITQPFKQAYREIYVITDAERETGTFSNRFANHILRQYEMLVLARINNWKITQWVAQPTPWNPPPHLVMPAHGLIAEFPVDPEGDPERDITSGYAFLYVSSGPVRFFAIDAKAKGRAKKYQAPRGKAVSLEEVPPIVFSEVMRQVDLFVGEASIASIADWREARAQEAAAAAERRAAAHAYWQEQAFGDLNPLAQTRKELLEALLPMLAIGGQCSIDGNYLRVEGKKRAYRIHLGSSNIMMEPNDQYLCIVPAQAKPGEAGAARVHLPFEGDTTLSLILSKAFLLASDDTITDPVILNQIGR